MGVMQQKARMHAQVMASNAEMRERKKAAAAERAAEDRAIAAYLQDKAAREQASLCTALRCAPARLVPWDACCSGLWGWHDAHDLCMRGLLISACLSTLGVHVGSVSQRGPGGPAAREDAEGMRLPT